MGRVGRQSNFKEEITSRMHISTFSLLLIFINIFQYSFSQSKFEDIVNLKWELHKSDINQLYSSKNMTVKGVMGFNGITFNDTIDNIPLQVGFLFDSEGNLKAKAFSNFKGNDKIFEQLKSKCIFIFGRDFREKSLLGKQSISWKLKNGEKVLLTLMKLNSCIMLSITRS